MSFKLMQKLVTIFREGIRLSDARLGCISLNKDSLNQMRTKWFGGKSIRVCISLSVKVEPTP